MTNRFTRHIPQTDVRNFADISFENALRGSSEKATDYDTDKWLYIPNAYTEYRYLLGTRGENPIICVGINPSTARPGELDPTLKSVERIAAANGYDSFLMLNVIAQRATIPDDMDREINEPLHAENMKCFEYVLRSTASPQIWAAWGTVIMKRRYLMKCLADIAAMGKKYNAEWLCAGSCSKAGHPHHPLYLKKNEPLKPFEIDKYLSEQLI